MVRKAGVYLSKRQKDELTSFMKKTKDKHEYRATMGILLRGAGKTAREVGEQLGVTGRRVFEWCKRYKKNGVKGLHMKRPTGRIAVEGARAKAVIPDLLKKDPQAFGYLKGRWVVRDIAKALKEEGVNLSFQQVNRVLHDMGISLKRPRLRAHGSIKKNYRKRAEVRNYKRISSALLKKG